MMMNYLGTCIILILVPYDSKGSSPVPCTVLLVPSWPSERLGMARVFVVVVLSS